MVRTRVPRGFLAYGVAAIIASAAAGGIAGGNAMGFVHPPDADLDSHALAKGILRYHFATYRIEELERLVDYALGGKTVELEIMGGRHVLDLSLNPIFEQEQTVAHGVYPLRGGFVEVPESEIRITVNLEHETLAGIVRTVEGERYVEPLFDGKGPVHLWYHADDAMMPQLGHTHPNHPVHTKAEAGPGGGTPAEHPPLPSEDEGNETAIGPMSHGNPHVYKLSYMRVYRDNADFDVFSVLHVVDDILVAPGGPGWRLHFLPIGSSSVETISTNGWRHTTCQTGSDAFMAKFKSERPKSGTGHNRNDHAMLFTNNPNIIYDAGGCAELSGSHSWVRWANSLKWKRYAAAHEFGHNLGAGHDNNELFQHCHDLVRPDPGACGLWHNHYTIMCCDAVPGYPGDDGMEMEYSSSSKSQMTWTPRYRAAILFCCSAPSNEGVKLYHWEIRYPNNPTIGGELKIQRSWAAESGTVQLQNRFIAARDCNFESCNRDFGSKGSQTLTTTPTSDSWDYTIDTGSTTWRFWPAYQHSSGWGPFEWKKITITVP